MEKYVNEITLKIDNTIEDFIRVNVRRYYPELLEYKFNIKEIGKALKKQGLEDNDLGMFCPDCRKEIKQHIYGRDLIAYEVKYCPWCGTELEWR